MQGNARPLEHVPDDVGEAATAQDDGQPQLSPQRMVRHDAEVAADVGDDDADRAVADLGICSAVGRRARWGSASAGSGGACGAGAARADGRRGGRGFGSGQAALRSSLASSAVVRSKARVMRDRISTGRRPDGRCRGHEAGAHGVPAVAGRADLVAGDGDGAVVRAWTAGVSLEWKGCGELLFQTDAGPL
jgi:hypothetical protein